MSSGQPTGFLLANPWPERIALFTVSGAAEFALGYFARVVTPGWETYIAAGAGLVVAGVHTAACRRRANQHRATAETGKEKTSDEKTSTEEISTEKTVATLSHEKKEKKVTKVAWTRQRIDITPVDTLADYWNWASIKNGEMKDIDPGKVHPYGLTFSKLKPFVAKQKHKKYEPLTAESRLPIGKHVVVACRGSGEKVEVTVVVTAKKLTLELSNTLGAHPPYGHSLGKLTKIDAGAVCPMDASQLAPRVIYRKKSNGDAGFQEIKIDWVPSVKGSPHRIQAQRTSHDETLYECSDWEEIVLTISRAPQVITCDPVISEWGDLFGEDRPIALCDAFRCEGAKGTLVFKNEADVVISGEILLSFGFDQKCSVFAEETDDYEESNSVKCTIHVLYSPHKWMQVFGYTDATTYSNCRMFPGSRTYSNIDLHFTTFAVFSSSLKKEPLSASEIFSALFDEGHHCTYELYPPGDAKNPRHSLKEPVTSTLITWQCRNWMMEQLDTEHLRIKILLKDSPMTKKASK